MVNHGALDVTLSDHKVWECAVCKAVNATRRAVPKQREYAQFERKPWERVWTDLEEKVCKDFWGNQYIVTFTYEFTRYTYFFSVSARPRSKTVLKMQHFTVMRRVRCFWMV